MHAVVLFGEIDDEGIALHKPLEVPCQQLEHQRDDLAAALFNTDKHLLAEQENHTSHFTIEERIVMLRQQKNEKLAFLHGAQQEKTMRK